MANPRANAESTRVPREVTGSRRARSRYLWAATLALLAALLTYVAAAPSLWCTLLARAATRHGASFSAAKASGLVPGHLELSGVVLRMRGGGVLTARRMKLRLALRSVFSPVWVAESLRLDEVGLVLRCEVDQHGKVSVEHGQAGPRTAELAGGAIPAPDEFRVANLSGTLSRVDACGYHARGDVSAELADVVVRGGELGASVTFRFSGLELTGDEVEGRAELRGSGTVRVDTGLEVAAGSPASTAGARGLVHVALERSEVRVNTAGLRVDFALRGNLALGLPPSGTPPEVQGGEITADLRVFERSGGPRLETPARLVVRNVKARWAPGDGLSLEADSHVRGGDGGLLLEVAAAPPAVRLALSSLANSPFELWTRLELGRERLALERLRSESANLTVAGALYRVSGEVFAAILVERLGAKLGISIVPRSSRIELGVSRPWLVRELALIRSEARGSRSP